MVDYLAAATAPVNGVFDSETDGKYLDVNIRPTGDKIDTHGGSDHAAFNRVGVPGFFWDEEGRADYGYGWHTQNDTLDLAIEEYLMQSATNAAITAYNLANAPDLLPREGETFEVQETEPTADAEQ
jgi:Zn-dependent M28 family amino/carboxypeptidase